jgi:hypothetical protein
MNYFQSTDFNAGFIYNVLERKVLPLLKKSTTGSVKDEIQIPLIQLLPKDCTAVTETRILSETLTTTLGHFEAVYSKSFNLTFENPYCIGRQYYYIPYTITKKVMPSREMTIADIEQALGYRIKVIG